MYLIPAYNIYNSNKGGYYCMTEQFGKLIFGEIERVTGSKRIIVNCENGETHSLSQSKASIYIFSMENNSMSIDNTLHLKNCFPNFTNQAFKIAIHMGVEIKERFCVSIDLKVSRPNFSTYQLAKLEYQKRIKNEPNLIIHNGIEVRHPKHLICAFN